MKNPPILLAGQLLDMMDQSLADWLPLIAYCGDILGHRPQDSKVKGIGITTAAELGNACAKPFMAQIVLERTVLNLRWNHAFAKT
jgi:hypothetical protein